MSLSDGCKIEGHPDCNLCGGTGENQTGVKMGANNHLCPRCGGYGTVPIGTQNPSDITEQDKEFIRNNRGEI